MDALAPSALCLEEDVFLCFAGLGRCLCDGRIADGNDDDGFFCLWHLEEFVATLGIEVANPTGAKTLFCGCQTKVLHSDGYVNITMRLAVRPHPLLFMEHGGKDIQGRFVEPRTRIARLELLPALLTADNAELPGLTVHRRGCKTHTLFDVLQLFFLDGFVKV